MLLFLEYDRDLEQEIEFEPSDTLLDGDLLELAEKLGIRPLEAFISASEEEYDAIETQWFDPAEGIETVDALLAALKDDDTEPNQWIAADLRELLTALHTLRESGCRFYLTMA